MSQPTRQELTAELARLSAEKSALGEQLEWCHLVAEKSPGMVFVLDLESRRIVYANSRFEELLGYGREQLQEPGFDFKVMIAPDSLEKVRRSHELHLSGEEHLPFEYTMLSRDGQRVEVAQDSWLAVSAGRRVVVGVITDLRVQQRLGEGLNRALERAETERARAESVIAALGESIIVQDLGYRVTYQNEINRRLFGDHLGELCYRAFEGLDHICPGCPVELTFRDGQVHRHVTTVDFGGRTLHMELTSSPLRDASGKIVAGLKLVRDITDQVEAAAALRQAKDELERQNLELRALDRLRDGLVRDVSHELKTPVAKQAMQLEILRLQLGPACDEPVERTLRVMEEAVHRQQRVIRNLLDLARLESGRRLYRLGPVRVDEVIDRVLEDYRPALDSAGFTVEVRAEPLTATADGELLWHVLSNLVSNAIKFGSRAGPRRLALSAAREESRAVIRVADNGIGLAPEELERVFERFYRATASVEGSGVGLSICRSIVEGMGGTIALASPGPGEGTTATVALPL